MTRRPEWLKVNLPGGGQYYEVSQRLNRLAVTTVCKEARCPNAAECWGCGTATFMILGSVCTRGCRFCAVKTAKCGEPVAADEPERIAVAALELGLRYVVLTSVDRDDLDDGGAAHFAATVRAVRRALPQATVEVLTPDFGGDPRVLAEIVSAEPRVLGHNLETVRRLTPAVRDRRCSYGTSLEVLRTYRRLSPHAVVKSSLLLGIGESGDEIHATLDDLAIAGVDWVTLGQYLQPTRKHLGVSRYLPPEEFDALAESARSKGFPIVTAGPLVRSSYKAGEQAAETLLKRRAC